MIQVSGSPIVGRGEPLERRQTSTSRKSSLPGLEPLTPSRLGRPVHSRSSSKHAIPSQNPDFSPPSRPGLARENSLSRPGQPGGLARENSLQRSDSGNIDSASTSPSISRRSLPSITRDLATRREDFERNKRNIKPPDVGMFNFLGETSQEARVRYMEYAYILQKPRPFIRHRLKNKQVAVNRAIPIEIYVSADLQQIYFSQEDESTYSIPTRHFIDACIGLHNAFADESVDPFKIISLFFISIKAIYLQASHASEARRWLKALLWLKSYINPKRADRKRADKHSGEKFSVQKTHRYTLTNGAEFWRYRSPNTEPILMRLDCEDMCSTLRLTRPHIKNSDRKIVPAHQIRKIDIRTKCPIFGASKWVFTIKFKNSHPKALHLAAMDEDTFHEFVNALNWLTGFLSKVGKPFNVTKLLSMGENQELTGQGMVKGLVFKSSLGKGGAGVVDLYFQHQLQRNLAVKKYNANSDIEEIEKEVQIMKDIVKHPKIAALVGTYKQDEGQLWVLMEYCDRGSLDDLLRKSGQRFQEGHIAYILRSTLEALKYLHQTCGIIHRDIKPANILFNSAGTLKLTDFGIAHMISQDKGEDNVLAGSPLYMPPEVFKGDRPGTWSDIWSTGIMAYELVHRVAPYALEATSFLALMELIVTNEPPTLPKTGPLACSENLQHIVKLMLVKEPSKRASVDELLQHPFLQGAELPDETWLHFLENGTYPEGQAASLGVGSPRIWNTLKRTFSAGETRRGSWTPDSRTQARKSPKGHSTGHHSGLSPHDQTVSSRRASFQSGSTSHSRDFNEFSFGRRKSRGNTEKELPKPNEVTGADVSVIVPDSPSSEPLTIPGSEDAKRARHRTLSEKSSSPYHSPREPSQSRGEEDSSFDESQEAAGSQHAETSQEHGKPRQRSSSAFGIVSATMRKMRHGTTRSRNSMVQAKNSRPAPRPLGGTHNSKGGAVQASHVQSSDMLKTTAKLALVEAINALGDPKTNGRMQALENPALNSVRKQRPKAPAPAAPTNKRANVLMPGDAAAHEPKDLAKTYVINSADAEYIKGNFRLNADGLRQNEAGGDDVKADGSSGKQMSLKDADLVTLGQIGRGVNGPVFKVLHLPTCTRLALKKLSVHTKATRHQLDKELKILTANVSSANLLSLMGAYYNPKAGEVCMASEYSDLGCLMSFVKNSGPIPEKPLSFLARQMFVGVDALHSHKYVHRDIKPENILISHDGRIKIADFGLVTEFTDLEETKAFLGTLSFLSPERILTEPYSYPADIWALGCSIIFCAMGKLDIASCNYWEVRDKVLQGQVNTLDKDNFSKEMHDFVAKCLTRDPKDRLTSEQALAHPWLRREQDKPSTETKLWLEQLQDQGSRDDVDVVFEKLVEYHGLEARDFMWEGTDGKDGVATSPFSKAAPSPRAPPPYSLTNSTHKPPSHSPTDNNKPPSAIKLSRSSSDPPSLTPNRNSVSSSSSSSSFPVTPSVASRSSSLSITEGSPNTVTRTRSSSVSTTRAPRPRSAPPKPPGVAGSSLAPLSSDSVPRKNASLRPDPNLSSFAVRPVLPSRARSESIASIEARRRARRTSTPSTVAVHLDPIGRRPVSGNTGSTPVETKRKLELRQSVSADHSPVKKRTLFMPDSGVESNIEAVLDEHPFSVGSDSGISGLSSDEPSPAPPPHTAPSDSSLPVLHDPPSSSNHSKPGGLSLLLADSPKTPLKGADLGFSLNLEPSAIESIITPLDDAPPIDIVETTSPSDKDEKHISVAIDLSPSSDVHFRMSESDAASTTLAETKLDIRSVSSSILHSTVRSDFLNFSPTLRDIIQTLSASYGFTELQCAILLAKKVNLEILLPDVSSDSSPGHLAWRTIRPDPTDRQNTELNQGVVS
eukprot:g46625.t1